MTPEQFVFWLRGYFAAGGNVPGNMTRGDWKAVMEMLKVVKSRTDPIPAPWRDENRERLQKEKEEFLRTLPPDTGSPPFHPPFITTSSEKVFP